MGLIVDSDFNKIGQLQFHTWNWVMFLRNISVSANEKRNIDSFGRRDVFSTNMWHERKIFRKIYP